MQCKACGGEIDNTTTTCPSCGAAIFQAPDEQAGTESSFNAQQEQIDISLSNQQGQLERKEEQGLAMGPKAKGQGLTKVFLIAAIIFALGIGGFLYYKRVESLQLDAIKKEELCTASVKGTVSDYEIIEPTRRDKKRGFGNSKYYPIFTYTINGTIYRYKSETSSGYMRFKRGEKVTVYYDPKNINMFYVAEDKADRSSWTSIIIRDAMIALIGLYVIWRYFLKRK